MNNRFTHDELTGASSGRGAPATTSPSLRDEDGVLIHYPPSWFREEAAKRFRAILEEWRETGREPVELQSLSTTEKITVLLAAGRASRLQAPIQGFFMLNAFQQKFVLNNLGLEIFAGKVVAGESVDF